jgi:hypothetical protein
MRKRINSIFLASLIAVMMTVGTASAFTSVTNVSANADFDNGNIVVDASIVCEAAGDYVVFEAMQTQGRHIGIAVLEVLPACVGTETISGPFNVPIFDGQSFRKGPFTLLAKVYNATSGAFVHGQGFQMKGK